MGAVENEGRAATQLDVSNSGDGCEENARCLQAGTIVAEDVCPNLRAAVVSEITVDAVPGVSVDAAFSEFRQCVQVVDVNLARFHEEILFQFRDVYGRAIHPSVVRELACCCFDSHEAAMTILESLQEERAIFE